jgi:hypothetical protein
MAKVMFNYEWCVNKYWGLAQECDPNTGVILRCVPGMFVYANVCRDFLFIIQIVQAVSTLIIAIGVIANTVMRIKEYVQAQRMIRKNELTFKSVQI